MMEHQLPGNKLWSRDDANTLPVISQSVIVPVIHSGSSSTVATLCASASLSEMISVKAQPSTRAVHTIQLVDSNVLVHAAFYLIQCTPMMTMIMLTMMMMLLPHSALTWCSFMIVSFHDDTTSWLATPASVINPCNLYYQGYSLTNKTKIIITHLSCRVVITS